MRAPSSPVVSRLSSLVEALDSPMLVVISAVVAAIVLVPLTLAAWSFDSTKQGVENLALALTFIGGVLLATDLMRPLRHWAILGLAVVFGVAFVVDGDGTRSVSDVAIGVLGIAGIIVLTGLLHDWLRRWSRPREERAHVAIGLAALGIVVLLLAGLVQLRANEMPTTCSAPAAEVRAASDQVTFKCGDS